MKKTFRFLSMAALLVVGAIMTGCSSDDNIDNPQQPANKDNVVTLTATVSLDGGAGTRAINPTSGVKTFESTNKIAVFYEDVDDKIQKAESGALTLSADKKTATFTVTLSNLKSGGNFRYVYPSTMAKDLDATPLAYPALDVLDDVTIDYSGLLGSQDGTLETIGTKYDLAVFDGSLAVTELPEWAGMGNPLAICKFTLKDGSSPITNSVTSLNVSDGTNTYHVTPSSLSEIYVAMKPVASGNIAFTAATGSKTYFKTATGATLTASKLYTNITVSMVELAVGKVFGSDGSIYAADATLPTGVTAVAKIFYLGSDAETSTTYNHGLALALEDVSGNKAWCSQTSATCLTNQYSDESAAKHDMAGIAKTDALVGHATHTHAAANAARNYNSGTHPTGTSAWFLPSAGQWDKMATAAGGYANLKTNAGLQSYYYWSSSEYDALYAWVFDAVNVFLDYDSKSYELLVRACLAF